MAWATTTNTRVVVRSGGHSFDGFPVQDDSILMDLRDLNRVALDESGRIELMPAATTLDVANALTPVNRIVPNGECPTVAMGGLVSGGGFGYASRQFGLTLDSLLKATIICSDGRIVEANAEENSDLFWACRGGAGCAGVMTDMLLQTYPVEIVTGFTSTWRWSDAIDVIALFSTVLFDNADSLDLKLKMRTTGPDRFIDSSRAGPPEAEPGTPLVQIHGQYLGEEAAARELLRPLLSHSSLLHVDVREESYHDAVLQLVPLDIVTNPVPKTLRPLRVASDLGRGAPSESEMRALIRFIEALQYEPDLNGGAIIIEPCNGKVAKVDPRATCFVHRDADLVYEWELFHPLPLAPEIDQRFHDLLTELRFALDATLTGGRYVNYADKLDSPTHWWGENLTRLENIVERHDPDHLLISRLHPLVSGE